MNKKHSRWMEPLLARALGGFSSGGCGWSPVGGQDDACEGVVFWARTPLLHAGFSGCASAGEGESRFIAGRLDLIRWD